MRKLILYFALVVLQCETSIANETTDCPDWREIRRVLLDVDRYSWQSIKDLRTFEEPCIDSESYRTLAQYLATIEGKIGNHETGLMWMDRFKQNVDYSVKPLEKFTVIEAIPYIVERAVDHRIVITNERHHASTDRLLPLFLLKPLYEQGFRYLAVETLNESHTINKLGYPTRYDGYYSNDVVYAQLLRSARSMGYEIVAYEQEDDQRAPEDPENPINRYDERDSWQAKNIISRTFKGDPKAKVLIHCGYGHVSESMLTRSTPMALFLKNLTGLDPLTISQTHFSERSESEREHPWRKQAIDLDLLDETPKVLMSPQGDLIRYSKSVDIEAIGLRTTYEQGRPIWMRMNGTRQPVQISTAACENRSCILEVFDPTEDEYAIPYDRLEVDHNSTATVYIPADVLLSIRTMDLDANLLELQSVIVE